MPTGTGGWGTMVPGDCVGPLQEAYPGDCVGPLQEAYPVGPLQEAYPVGPLQEAYHGTRGLCGASSGGISPR